MSNNVTMFPGHKWLVVGRACAACRGSKTTRTMTTHCPQLPLDTTMRLAVQQGSADFKDGEWRYYGYTAREVFDV